MLRISLQVVAKESSYLCDCIATATPPSNWSRRLATTKPKSKKKDLLKCFHFIAGTDGAIIIFNAMF